MKISRAIFYVAFVLFVISAAGAIGTVIFAHFNDRTGFLVILFSFIAAIASVTALIAKCISDE